MRARERSARGKEVSITMLEAATNLQQFETTSGTLTNLSLVA